MKFPTNFLRSFVPILLWLTAAPVTGQAPPEIPRFQLCAGMVGFDQPPHLYWMDVRFDSEGQPVYTYKPLDVAVGGRGPVVEIPIPSTGPVRLYRQTRAETGDVVREAVVEIPRPEPEERLFMLLFQTGEGKRGVRFLDDSAGAHPPGTVRILNVSGRDMVASIGRGPTSVEAGGDRNLGAPPTDGSGRFHYQYAVSKSGRTWTSPELRLRLRGEGHRLLVLYTLLRHSRNAGGGGSEETLEPVAYRVYDRIDLPEDDEEEPRE